jgi:hypothetical protein
MEKNTAFANAQEIFANLRDSWVLQCKEAKTQRLENFLAAFAPLRLCVKT